MWQDIEARIEENDCEQVVPLRKNFLLALGNAGLRPGQSATKKMVVVETEAKERLVWQIEGSAQHFYLHQKWQPRLEAENFLPKPFLYQQGVKDGGRHSALSRDWSFGTADCVQVRLATVEALRRLTNLVCDDRALKLDPAAVTRWIDRLRLFFPGLERFDKPDEKFDVQERNYKLEIGARLRSALDVAATDEEHADAIYAALAKSNLLPWRAYWPMSAKGDADREMLWPALSSLGRSALGAPDGHAAALENFVAVWEKAVPKASTDAARQIAEFVLMHLAPDAGSYIRHTVREDLWLEAVGSKFPVYSSMAETYAEEQRFMRAVRKAFDERGLSPRDMIDVQSALWVVHGYKAEDDGDPASTQLSRDIIEAAMDAYDLYKISPQDNEIFDSFAEPRDFWVRSTRKRDERVYPTKPLIGFILKKTELNGGWGQKFDAAARLHNAGFVIVDQDDKPVVPPERYNHLIRGRTRVQLCAANYFIEPARELGATDVSIRAGDFKTVLGLEERTPAICAALNDEALQRIANVSAPERNMPDDSRHTAFKFQLAARTKQLFMTNKAAAPIPSATNLILYGPPGTGKTYQTAWEAVRLCLGAQAAASLQQADNRNALMEEYRRLVSDGRIEFVTFHQSMSYEEFVEGLRPSTGDEADEGPEDVGSTSGFRLKPHDGVFKRISERARLDRGNTALSARLDRAARVFKVALGARHVHNDRIRFGLDNGLIHVGWGGDIDWSDERFEDFNQIYSEWRAKKDPAATGHDGNIVITWSLRSDMQVGDYVVVSDGRDRIQAFGRVTGEYFFDQDAAFHPHRRPVEWLWRDNAGAERSRFYSNPFRRHSVYKLNQSLVDWDALEEIVFGDEAPHTSPSARDHVLIIDEINRANISKVFGELITLLEPDKRLALPNEIRLVLPYSKKPFGVPANLHIIGTMNTADRSIALLDTALRRRFTFRELMPDPFVLSHNLDGINLQKLLSTINDRIEYLFDREHQIGHAYFTGCTTRYHVENVMRHKVIPLLAEYFYEDWSKVAAVLGDIAGSRERFLESRQLSAPAGMAEDELLGEKLRWRVKDQFDFSEFSS